MSHFRLFLILVGLSLAAVGVHAQEPTGFNLHGGVGASTLHDRDGDEVFAGNAFAYTFGAEYRFTRHIGLGLDGFDLGTAKDTVGGTDTRISAVGFIPYLRLILPVAESVELFGRIGTATYFPEVSPGSSFALLGEDATEFGVGADIGSGKLAFRLQARYFDGRRDESAGLLTAGLNYQF